MAYVFRLRRASSLNWASQNPVLDEGEPGYDKDTGILKIGDGRTAWIDLKPFIPILPGIGATDEALLNHIQSHNPHPIYDDGPSLFLLYQNAKV